MIPYDNPINYPSLFNGPFNNPVDNPTDAAHGPSRPAIRRLGLQHHQPWPRQGYMRERQFCTYMMYVYVSIYIYTYECMLIDVCIYIYIYESVLNIICS